MSSIFADAYSRYMTGSYNYKYRLQMFKKIFRNSYVFMKSSQFLNKDFVDRIGDFPKFPYFFNLLVGTDSLNLVNIYNSTLDNTDGLLDSMVGLSELSKKSKYDLIPTELNRLKQEAYFQYSYLSSLTDIYDYESRLKSFIVEDSYRNFFSDLYGTLFYSNDQSEGDTAGLEDGSFIVEYMLYCPTITLLEKSHDFYAKLLNYIIYINTSGPSSERLNRDVVIDDFTLFVNSFYTKVSFYLSELILRSIYSFDKVSNQLKSNIIGVISSKILDPSSGLAAAFSSFLNNTGSLDPMFLVTSNSVSNLNGIMSADCVSKIFDDTSILTSTFISGRLDYEEEQYSTFVNKISQNSLQNYLFLCFLYKFWPSKFLNVLQLVTREYVEEVIKTPSDSFEDQDEYIGNLGTFISSNINYTTLKSFLDGHVILTPSNYLYNISNNYQVPQFGCFAYYITVIDSFFASDNLSTFITELVELIFIYLRDNGHIDYDYDWYSYHEVVEIYLKMYTRWKLLDKSTVYLNSDLAESSFKFTNGSTSVYCKDLSSYNSVSVGNYIFAETDSIDYALSVSSKSIIGGNYVLRLSSNYTGTTSSNWIAGYGYTISLQCLFNNVTSRFTTLYNRVVTNSTSLPTYDISIAIPSSADLYNIFDSVTSSETISDSMYQFTENMSLSALTREIIYGTLADFVT